jgi:hypothetical protein
MRAAPFEAARLLNSSLGASEAFVIGQKLLAKGDEDI